MAQQAKEMIKSDLSLGYYANDPNIKVIAPWREWNLKSRTQLLEFAMENQIAVPKDKQNEAPYSMDANLLHTSYEGKNT